MNKMYIFILNFFDIFKLTFTKVKVLRVEGLDLAFNNKEQLVKKAIFDLKEWIEEFSHRNK